MQPTIGIREMNKIEVLILRFVLHSSMLLGARHNPDGIKNLISCRPQHLEDFLIAHLKTNLSRIAQAITSNEETAQLLLHMILHTMLNDPQKAAGNEWTTKETIKNFENSFAKEIVRRTMTSTNQLSMDMKALRSQFKEDMDGAKSAVLTILEEEGEETLAKSVWQPQFWHPRVTWNIDCLEQHLGGRKKLKASCPYLFRLLSAVEKGIVKETKHLPAVLVIQRYIMNLFNGNLDVHVISKLSVQDFFKHYWPRKDAPAWKKRLEDYLKLLDRLKTMMFDELGSLGIKARDSLKHPEEKLCMDSNCSILFPNSYGLGNFSLAIVLLLVEAHNTCLDNSRTLHMNEINETSEFINCEIDDLNMILLANSTYELEISGKGQANKFDISIQGLESMIYEKYFKKPKYDFKSSPKFKYRHQVSNECKLSEKIEQEKRLPRGIINQLERELKGAQEVGYIIAQLAIVRGVLANTSGMKTNELILDFMGRLKIKIKGDYKGLQSVTLTQIDCLLRFLNLLRAKMLVEMEMDPFMTILHDELKEPILAPEVREKIGEFCHHVQPDLILECLFNCITDKLTSFDIGEQGNYLEMPLRDLIVNYLEYDLDENEKAEQFQRLHPDILVKNASDMFRIIAMRKFEK